jgi:hypothetical protein
LVLNCKPFAVEELLYIKPPLTLLCGFPNKIPVSLASGASRFTKLSVEFSTTSGAFEEAVTEPALPLKT